jgi:ligand-binding sensor domain-containing protein
MNYLRFILILLAISAFTNNLYAQDFWLELNIPDSLRIRNLKSNSFDELFIGTNHGLYYSNDHGEIIDYLSLNNSIMGLYIDSSDNIYAGNDTIYYSNENGIEWDTIITPSISVHRIYSDCNYLISLLSGKNKKRYSEIRNYLKNS